MLYGSWIPIYFGVLFYSRLRPDSGLHRSSSGSVPSPSPYEQGKPPPPPVAEPVPEGIEIQAE